MQTLSKLTGPEFLPVSGNAPKQIVIMLHGVGADGENLLGLAYEFCKILPDAYFTAPNGCQPYDGGGMGYQWFSLWDRSPAQLLAGLQVAQPLLKDFIDEKCAQFNLDYSDVVLLGFSQGSMMSFHTAFRLPKTLAGVIAYSGAMVDYEPQAEEITAKPPTIIIHGKLDEVVPFKLSHLAFYGLKKHDVEVEHHEIEGLGHSIDMQGIELAKAFLKKVFL
jgi:phospholipase/carboxylesterase